MEEELDSLGGQRLLLSDLSCTVKYFRPSGVHLKFGSINVEVGVGELYPTGGKL